MSRPVVRTVCAVCGLTAAAVLASQGTALHRFALVHPVWNPITKRSTTRGAGSILLCAEDWNRYGRGGGTRRRSGPPIRTFANDVGAVVAA